MNLSSRHNIKSLKSRDEISFLFNKGKKLSFRFGLIILLKKRDKNKYAGILVKKNFGNAVKRNYAKRLLRHYVRENPTLLSKYNRVIFLVSKRPKDFTAKNLFNELDYTLKNYLSESIKNG